jgi:hypothetical protein
MTSHVASAPGGWVIDGFDALIVLAVWSVLVLLYGLYRSVSRPDPDEIRSSGPVF